MPRIFDDKGDDSGQIWSNPFGTKSILPLGVVAEHMKWPTLRRVSRLASNKMGCAGTASLIVHRP